MPRLARAARLGGLLVALAGGLVSCTTPQSNAPLGAGEVLAKASQAMGASQLKTLRYVGEGSGYTFGQAYQPGGAWPRITLDSVIRTIDFEAAAMRDEIVLSRAEPRGGGGYPLVGQQRNDQFISGEMAWNQAGTTTTSGPRFVTDRMHQLWITPHGVLKAAARHNASARRGADGGSALSFAQPGRFSVTSVHVSGELFKSLTGTQMQHVPYKGRQFAIPHLVGRQIQLMFDNMPSA